MKSYLSAFVVGIIAALVLGIVCGIFGAFLASVISPSFEFGAAVGYEAGGIIFFLLGSVVGGLYGTILMKHHSLTMLFSRKTFIFTVVFYGMLLSLWFGCGVFHKVLHLPRETQAIILAIAWAFPPYFVLRRNDH